MKIYCIYFIYNKFSSTPKYIFSSVYVFQVMSGMFASGPSDRGSIPGLVIPKS